MSCKDNNFKVSDQVIHCREGLAVIFDVASMGERDYFLVKSNRGDGETIYVPHETAPNIIRHLMNVEEADELLRFMKGIEKNFNTNTKQRRDAFKRSLSSGDVKEIASLSRLLYFFNELGPDNGEIKLGPVDLDMLEYADNMLMDELAITFNVGRDSINQFINERIDRF